MGANGTTVKALISGNGNRQAIRFAAGVNISNLLSKWYVDENGYMRRHRQDTFVSELP